MKSRLIATLGLGVAIALGTTGCAMISEQGTTIQYSPSDGVSVEGSSPLEVRNAFVVANEDGSIGGLVAAVVNPTDGPLTLTIEVNDSGVRQTVRVPADSVVSFGSEDVSPLALENLNTRPGATVRVYFQSGDENGVGTDLPVLDGTLPYYAHLVPNAG